LQNRKTAGSVARIPAPEIETLVCDGVRRHLGSMGESELLTTLAERELIERHVAELRLEQVWSGEAVLRRAERGQSESYADQRGSFSIERVRERLPAVWRREFPDLVRPDLGPVRSDLQGTADKDLEWRDVLVGAVVTAFLFNIGKFLIGLTSEAARLPPAMGRRALVTGAASARVAAKPVAARY
jgi:hypothetical protein